MATIALLKRYDADLRQAVESAALVVEAYRRDQARLRVSATSRAWAWPEPKRRLAERALHDAAAARLVELHDQAAQAAHDLAEAAEDAVHPAPAKRDPVEVLASEVRAQRRWASLSLRLVAVEHDPRRLRGVLNEWARKANDPADLHALAEAATYLRDRGQGAEASLIDEVLRLREQAARSPEQIVAGHYAATAAEAPAHIHAVFDLLGAEVDGRAGHVVQLPGIDAVSPLRQLALAPADDEDSIRTESSELLGDGFSRFVDALPIPGSDQASPAGAEA